VGRLQKESFERIDQI